MAFRSCLPAVVTLSAGLVSGLVAHAATDAVDPAKVLPPIHQRFATGDTSELPNFQRHVVNLFGRLGCNSRGCHGSFQGQGGFRLSLFGYDFKADHDALLEKGHERVNLEQPQESLIIAKPTDADNHEGGQRYKTGSWQHHVLSRWIEGGAKRDERPQQLVRLDVTPAEIWFRKHGERVPLKAVAVWEDGTREDVTPLCRFQTNGEQVATIDEAGLVRSAEPGDTHVVVSYDRAVVPVPVLRPLTDKIGGKYPAVPTPNKIDELVVAKLRKLGVVPSETCPDAEFLRRVSLDLTGTLPAPKEVEQFLADTAPKKRSQKIDELLKTPAYTAWWTTKLCDFTGNNDEQLNNNLGPRRGSSQEWYDWIYKRVAQNVPYDQLVEGIVTAVSRRPGQDYLQYCEEMTALYRDGSDKSYADRPCLTYYWSRRDFRDPDARAVAFGYSFLGIRIQCAQCHKHPFDQWSKDDFHQFKNFFATVSTGERGVDQESRQQFEQLVEQLGGQQKYRDNQFRNKELPALLRQGTTVPFPEVYVTQVAQGKPKNGNPKSVPPSKTARLPSGEQVDLTSCGDPRTVVMNWLRDKRNPYFARAFVNRVWASYFHVGIVDPPDDHSLANPPSNKALLDYLAEGFIQNGFDMQWVHRQILNSRTYQLSWEPNKTNGKDQTNFSHAIPRRLPAEVVYDALRQAVASDDKADKLRANMNERAIAIPGSVGRANRLGGSAYVLTAFGRSSRRSNCDCDRSEEPSLLQTVYLQNDREFLQLLDSNQGGWVAQVTAPLRARTQPSANDAKNGQVRGLRGQIDSLTNRLQKNQDVGNKENAERMTARLASLKQELARLQPPTRPPAEQSELVVVAQHEIVRQAYLRTLSRPPSDEERSRAQQFLAQSEDPSKGVRDLLWALLNTKEFIVNH